MEHSEMSAVLATARLRLRALRPDDAAAIAAGIGDCEVARWLPQLPWPYALKDAEDFMRDPVSIGAWLIEISGEVAGVVHIGLTGELGYWLARAFHGCGYMTEAAEALVARHFANGGGDLISGYLLGNGPSCNVLTKLGFANTHLERRHARPLNAEVEIQRMALSAEDWAARQAGVIRTARLVLRPLRPSDARAIAEGIGDWEVIRWLILPPWPYVLADAEWFIGDPVSDGARVIEIAGQAAGIVSISADNDLGYWLARPFHGLGYMTEAAGALVAQHFAQGGGPLTSGYLLGNGPSCNVLTKLGFSNTFVERSHARPLTAEVDVQRMGLSAEDFRRAPPWEARSARLTFRSMQPRDTDALHALHSDWAVVRQLGTWPWPPERDFAATRAQPFGGDGFVWGVFLDGGLVGTFGLTDGIVGYSLAQAQWGKGLGTELAMLALDHGFKNFQCDQVTASVWDDNAASLALLHRAGFREVGRSVEMSKARRVAAGLVHLGLSRAEWLARPKAGNS